MSPEAIRTQFPSPPNFKNRLLLVTPTLSNLKKVFRLRSKTCDSGAPTAQPYL